MTAPWRRIWANTAFEVYTIDPARATILVEPARALPANRADLLRAAASRLAPNIELGPIHDEDGELRARGSVGAVRVIAGVACHGLSAIAYVLAQAPDADHAGDAKRLVGAMLATARSPFAGWID